MSVRETLELDISEALERVQAVGDALTEIARAWGDNLRDAVSQAFEDLPIVEPPVLDTAPITEQVSEAIEEATQPEQTVDVVAAGSIGEWIQEEIDSVDASVEVDVTANTEQAQEQIDGLSTSGQGAAGSLDNLSTATESLDSVAGFAAGGGVGAFGGQLKGYGPAGIAAAAGLAVTAGAFGSFYSAALESVSVSQAYEATLGDLGVKLEDLDGGTTGLTGTISDLTVNLGSSDEAVKRSLIRFGQLQQTTNFTDDEIANFGQTFFGVAATLRAQNPSLGEVDSIMDRLFRTLATGGPRLGTLGIDLNKADIEARALKISGKEMADSLTFAERQAAGISLAAEQLGIDMDTLSAGMENAQIRAERMSERFGEVQEQLGTTFLLAFQDSLERVSESVNELILAMEPFIRVQGVFFAELLGEIGDALSGVSKAVKPLADLLDQLPIDELGNEAESASVKLSVLKGVMEGLIDLFFIGINAPGLKQAIDVLSLVGQLLPGEEETEETDGAAQAMGRFADRVAAAALAQAQAAIETEKLAAALQVAGQSAFEFYSAATSNIPSVTQAFQDLSAEMGTDQILESLDKSLTATTDWITSIQDQLSQGNENVAALMSQLGADKSRILLESYGGELEDLENHLRDLYEAELNARAEIRGIAVEQFLIQSGETAAAAAAITESFRASLLLGDATVESIGAAREAFYNNLGTLGGSELGTTESTNFAAALNITTPTTDQLALISGIWQAATTPGEAGQVGLDTALFFAAALGESSPLTVEQINTLVGIIKGGGWYAAGTEGGGAAGSGVSAGLDDKQGEVGASSSSIADEISDGINKIRWSDVGSAVVDGIINGIQSKFGELASTAREIAMKILGPLGFILQFGSPSRVMFDRGVDTVEGLRLGMESQIGSIAAVSAEIAQAASISPELGAFGTGGTSGLVVGAGTPGLTDPGAGRLTEINVTVPVTVGAGMSADDGERIGRTAGVAASQELRRVLRLEGVIA